MAMAAVHLDPDTFRVLGVWLSPTSFAYLRTKDGGLARTVGSQLMAGKGPALSWDDWARHLAESRPSIAKFQAIFRRDGEEPRHVLARAVALEAVELRNRSEG